jgi:hypothetical protein
MRLGTTHGSLRGAVALLLLSLFSSACGSDANPGTGGQAGTTGGGAGNGSGGAGATNGGGAGNGGVSAGVGGANGGSAPVGGSTQGGAGNGSGGSGPAVGLKPGHLGVGESTACALDATGKILCFGGVGDGPETSGNVQISVASNAACVIDSAQAVHCWGDLATSATGTFSQVVVAGHSGACGIKVGGDVVCWGDAGDPAATWTVPADKFTGIAATDGYACGVRTDGTIACWGSVQATMPPSGMFAQVFVELSRICGLTAAGDAVCKDFKVVSPPAGKKFAELAVRGGIPTYACGLEGTGAVTCWDGSPAVTAPPGGVFVDIVAGSQLCGVLQDGSIKCWGDGALAFPSSFHAF